MEWEKLGAAAFVIAILTLGLYTLLSPAMLFLGPNQIMGSLVVSAFISVLVVGAGWGVLKLSGKGQGSPEWLMVLAAVAVVGMFAFLIAAMFGYIKTPGSVGGGITPGSPGNIIISGANAPSLYVNSVDYMQKGVAVSATSSYVYGPDGGFLKDNLAANTAYTINAVGKHRVITNKTAYFASEDFAQGDGTNSPVNIRPELAAAGTATVSIMNPGTGYSTANAETAHKTFGANDAFTFKVIVTGQTLKAITNPKPTINGVAQPVQVTFTLKHGVVGGAASDWLYADDSAEYMTDSSGNNHCVRGVAPNDANQPQAAFTCALDGAGIGTAEKVFYLTVAASTGNPAAQNGTLALYGWDIYRNSKSGETQYGIQTDTGSLLHSAVNSTLYTD